jgi:CheY-like chemotaxis protein
MRILIVDDAPDVGWVFQRQLQTLGHEVLALQDSRKALDYAKTFHPDVIVMDICMPGMDGWDVGAQIRADPATRLVRLVAVTAMSGKANERRSAEVGFDNHFGKPVPLDQWPRVLGSVPTV